MIGTWLYSLFNPHLQHTIHHYNMYIPIHMYHKTIANFQESKFSQVEVYTIAFCFYSQCHLYRGVHPLLYEAPVNGNWFEDVDQRLLAGLDKGRREGYISKGSTIVLLSGWRPGPANINTIRIFQVHVRACLS